jgi:hypothetical protein
VIENAASEADEVPSDTEIAIPEVDPTLAAAGVPVSAPVVLLKVAQLGLFWIEKVSVPPLGSVVLGVKLYAEPAVTDVPGVPAIVGGAGGGGGVFVVPAVTAIAKEDSEALLVPFDTVMTMPG